MSKKYIDIANARQADQRQVMRSIAAAEHCPFCTQNLEKYHKQPIIREGQFWLLTTNQWPYDHTKFHWLLISTQHAESPAELKTGAGDELIEFVADLEKQHSIPGGGLVMRFGDTSYSAGTVRHLHVQLLVPDVAGANFEPIRIKIGSKPESVNQ